MDQTKLSRLEELRVKNQVLGGLTDETEINEFQSLEHEYESQSAAQVPDLQPENPTPSPEVAPVEQPETPVETTPTMEGSEQTTPETPENGWVDSNPVDNAGETEVTTEQPVEAQPQETPVEQPTQPETEVPQEAPVEQVPQQPEVVNNLNPGTQDFLCQTKPLIQQLHEAFVAFEGEVVTEMSHAKDHLKAALDWVEKVLTDNGVNNGSN